MKNHLFNGEINRCSMMFMENRSYQAMLLEHHLIERQLYMEVCGWINHLETDEHQHKQGGAP